jgi:hypothetical protein
MNKINQYAIVVILAMITFSCVEDEPIEEKKRMQNGKYQTGQVWTYSTRKGEEASKLFIVHIDQHEKLGNIYHIFVDGLSVKNLHIEDVVNGKTGNC